MSDTHMMTLRQAFDWIAARVPSAKLIGDANTVLHRVHTDTRTLAPGDLFVALKGEHFDANDFLAQAKASGAAAALAHPSKGADAGLAACGLSGIEVPHTTQALGALAAGWRSQFTLPLIAVTGSNGKTTVTQMIASVLAASQPGHTLATQGNFNNDIGVPLTLLRLRAEHRLAVVELGMNHPGEIAYLAELVRPTVALVNNAQREHQEFMATVEAVAQENGAVLSALSATGVAVFPADEAYTPLWHTLAGSRQVLDFAVAAPAQVWADEPVWADGAWAVQAHAPAGEARLRLGIAGRHNVKNALAALACALAAGVRLAHAVQGLVQFQAVKGRSHASSLAWGGRPVTLVDDTYNANPDSVRAAIDVLADLPGSRILVLGDMGEVGDQGPEFHAEVGRYAHERGIDHVLALGDLARHTVAACLAAGHPAAQHFTQLDSLTAHATGLLAAQGQGAVQSIVVKGSRFMKMERVVEALRAAASTAAPVSVPSSSTVHQGGLAC